MNKAEFIIPIYTEYIYRGWEGSSLKRDVSKEIVTSPDNIEVQDVSGNEKTLSAASPENQS